MGLIGSVALVIVPQRSIDSRIYAHTERSIVNNWVTQLQKGACTLSVVSSLGIW